jgi:photosystem II stability/assembly factor-like uncharacterized protein
LLRSRNGGRDWAQEPGAPFAAAVYAVLFEPRSGTAFASTANRIYRQDKGGAWTEAQAPAGAAPAHLFVAGARRLYIAGGQGVYASDDGGNAWRRAGEGLPEAPVTSLALVPGTKESLLAVSQGVLWTSGDDGATWKPRALGTGGAVDTVAFDAAALAVSQDQLYRSDDAGVTWTAVGRPLPERGTSVRGIAMADGGKVLMLTTHRGMLHSLDGGATWALVEGVLPVHIEAGPMRRDPTDASTLYAGFSLTPYTEIWRRAAGGANLLAQLDPVSLAGAGAFLVLLAVGSAFGVRWLQRARA